jgi:para-nitrobenzyl esterase
MDNKQNLSGVGRRTWMKTSAGLAAAAVAAGGARRADAKPPAATSEGTLVVVSDTNAIVETTAGKVQGFTRNGIETFKGIPYAASAGGGARFLPPSKPEPWKETRTSLWYGKTCPQEARGGWESDVVSFLSEWDDGQPGENCLRVNVWSPGLDRKKRPVMFWIHGGGFSAGSGQEQPAYHGENLARRGDVVVVSVNHRLAGGFRAAGCGVGERGHAGPGRRARMGARQHRQFRRRSRQRSDFRPVGRRVQS